MPPCREPAAARQPLQLVHFTGNVLQRRQCGFGRGDVGDAGEQLAETAGKNECHRRTAKMVVDRPTPAKNVTNAVSRTAPENRNPSTSTTRNSCPCSWIGCRTLSG